MNMTEESLITDFAEMLITTRRSILPKRLFEPGPNDEELELIFSAAASAPDHGLIRTLSACYRDWETDRKSTRLNSSHLKLSRMPSSA